MRFKNAEDQRDWDNSVPDQFDKTANQQLKRLAEWIDLFCVLIGWGEVTVTSYYRPQDKDSYHSIYQAADLRTHDKPFSFKIVCQIFDQIFRWGSVPLQVFVHKELWGTPNEHIHIAVKDGKIPR